MVIKILEVVAGVELALILGAAFAIFRLLRRLVQYDTVFQYLAGDIQTNLKQFEQMSQSTFFINDSEVQKAHNNMMIMSRRLNEILTQMEEVSALSLRPPAPPPPPKVV